MKVYEGKGVRTVVAPFHGDRLGGPSEWITFTHQEGKAAWSLDSNTLYMTSPADGHMCIWAWRFNPRTHAREGDPYPVVHFHKIGFELEAGPWSTLAAGRKELIVT